MHYAGVVTRLHTVKQAYLAAKFTLLRKRANVSLISRDNSSGVMLVSSNGAGLGHLTRVVAVAEAMDEPPLIYTFCSAFEKIGYQRNAIKHHLSPNAFEGTVREWKNSVLGDLGNFLENASPRLVIFDGTFVYEPVIEACVRRGIPILWLQRGCWKAEISDHSLQKKLPEFFVDGLIIPRDYGAVEPKPIAKVPVMNVAPIVRLDRNAVLKRTEAIQALGLRDDKQYVVIQLGSGALKRLETEVLRVVAAIRGLGENWEPVVVQNPQAPVISGVNSVQAMPLSLYLEAFEFGVFAVGYNTVQECVALRFPALYIPNEHTITDDQVRRAHGMAEKGYGLIIDSSTTLEDNVRRLSDAAFRAKITDRLGKSEPPSGAEEVAAQLRTYGGFD